MKRLFLPFASYLVVLSCTGEQDYKRDYDSCLQNAPDYTLLMSGPMESRSIGSGWDLSGLSLDISVDSFGYESFQYEDRLFPDYIVKAINYGHVDESDNYLVQGIGAFCYGKSDTCFTNSARTPSYEIYRHDTLAWSSSDGWSTSPEIISCNLDSGGFHFLWTDHVEKYDRRFVRDVVIIDSVSDPAYRSIYQQWWPLPRKPWPKGESVIADSTIWADSVADSLEVWTYPWRHNDQDEFVEFPL